MGYYVLSEDAAAKLRKLLGDASLIEIRAGALQQQPARPMNDPVLYVRVTSLTKTDGRQPGYWQKYIADTDTWSDGDDCWVETPTAITTLPLGKYLARRFGTRASDGYPIFVADDSGGAVEARKGSGSYVGPRPKISFIEGTGCTLTVADDPTAGEIDVTIAVSGSGSTLTVQESDGTPLVASVNTIKLDQSDGLTLTDDTGGVVSVTIKDASWTQDGIVNVTDQEIAGHKSIKAATITFINAGGFTQEFLDDDSGSADGFGTFEWGIDTIGNFFGWVMSNASDVTSEMVLAQDASLGTSLAVKAPDVTGNDYGGQFISNFGSSGFSYFYYNSEATDFPTNATTVKHFIAGSPSTECQAALWYSGGAVWGLTTGDNPRFAVYKGSWKEGISGTWVVAGAGVDAGKEISLTFNGGILTLAEEAEA